LVSASKWQVSRRQFGFALGFLLAISAKLHGPIWWLVGFALAGGVTAMRFHSLKWKPSRAFIPLAIAALASAFALTQGPQSSGAVILFGAALTALLGMIVRSIFAWADCDPRSPKTALLLETVAKRRDLLALAKEGDPLRVDREQAYAAMMALHAELQAHSEAHGWGPSAEREAIQARMAEQQKVIDRVRAVEAAHLERRRAARDRLEAATKALKEYKRAA
jgi:hypothetical protein